MSNLLDEAARNDELAYAYDSGKTEGEERGREEGRVEVQHQWELDKISTIQGMLNEGLNWRIIENITHLNESSYDTLCKKHLASS